MKSCVTVRSSPSMGTKTLIAMPWAPGLMSGRGRELADENLIKA